MNAESRAFLMPAEQYPSWRFFRRRRRLERLAGGPTRRYSFLWARNALYHALTVLGVEPGDRVLLPAYLCAAAVEPFLVYGAAVDFYEVQVDGRPDVSDLEAKITVRTRALMCVHYFGFPQPVALLRQFCRDHGLWLIEDCAHALPSDDPQGMGNVGDVSVYSWRKLLPVGDGAMLVINGRGRALSVNWERESMLVMLKVAKDLCDRMLVHAGSHWASVVHGWLQWPKRLLGSRLKHAALPVECDTALFDPRMVGFRMTRLSSWVLAHSDMDAIRMARRRNFEFLVTKTLRIPGVRAVYGRLPEGICPWVCPIFIEGVPGAHRALRELGIPAVSWDGVRPAGMSWDQFPVSDFLYENLVFLPVHQNLARADLETIVEAVESVAKQAAGAVADSKICQKGAGKGSA